MSDHGTVSAREMWGTRWGFVLAAVGSAVGLGNMWRFSYVAAEGGGAAFVFLYILMVFSVGVPIMLCEMTIGRKTHLSPVGALRKIGGSAWVPLGILFVVTGFLILSYYSVIAGWTIRYALEGITTGFPADPGAHFDSISTGPSAIGFHLFFMAVTIGVVMVGVQKGIERAALILMPTLFLIVLGLAVWALTLEGAGEGYAFYLRPDLGEINGTVVRQAASQAFFSLSLGMGAMLTFASYLSRDTDLVNEAVTISFADFLVAFTAGLVVFPVVFALGLQDQVSDSTVGALFISLPGAFQSMGAIGRVVGTLFFLALLVGALTSAISLLEVVASSIIDEFSMVRRNAAVLTGILIALFGLLSATSLDVLGVVDQLAGALFLVIGGFFLCLFVGWVMKEDAVHEMMRGAAPGVQRLLPGVLVIVRWVLPPVIGVVLYFSLRDAWGAIIVFVDTL